MKKITMFIFACLFVSSLCFLKSSPCQNKMQWNWIERDTIFSGSGICQIPRQSSVKFVDIDRDGQTELVLGTENDLQLYRNIASIEDPVWKLVPDFFKKIEEWISKGFDFEDIDNDGRLELITTYYHFLDIYENLGSLENPNWKLDSLYYRYKFIPDMETSPIDFPELIDFDKDGDFDIALVRYNNFGVPKLTYYVNNGSNEYPVWQLNDLFFSGCAEHYGTIAPTFVDIDSDGDLDLFYQSSIEEFSFLQCYKNVSILDSILWKEFRFPTPIDDFINYGVYDFDWHDVDHDGDFDLVLSSGTRSLFYFENIGNSTEPKFEEHPNNWGEFDVGHHSCVFIHDFDRDSNYDLAIFGYSFGFVNDVLLNRSYKNQSGNVPGKYAWQEVNWLNLKYRIDSGAYFVYYLTIAPYDFDQDNDIDIAIYVSSSGQTPEMINCFLLQNKGDNKEFVLEVDELFFGTLKTFTKNLHPVFGDLDGDGDIDMMGIDSGKVKFFENVGIKNKYAIQSKPLWASGDSIDLYAHAQLVDLDFDDDLDLALGFENGSLMCYFNKGTKQQPVWRKDTSVFSGVQTDQWSSPFLVDFDHDGDLDLISGNGWGGVHYFENQSFLSVQTTGFKVEMYFHIYQNYPNPFNLETNISFQVPEASYVVLKVFNLLGKEIKTLVNETKPAGYHTVRWDGRNNYGNKVVSGLYLYQIKAGNFSCIKKMALMK